MLIAKITENTALLAFLRAELDSPTERLRLIKTLEQLQLSEQAIIDNNPEEASPWEIFMAYRGSEKLFDGLNFHEISWYQATLTEEDLNARTVTCRNHFEHNFGTRKPSDIAQQLNLRIPAVPNGVLGRIYKGHILEPPLLLTDSINLERLVILEGHNRLISYLRDTSAIQFPLNVLIGVSPYLSRWCQW